MTDMGDIHWLLGVEVKHDQQKHTMTLSQHAYIDTILTHFNLTNANPVSVLMEPGLQLSHEHSPSTAAEKAEMADVPYREAIGSLIYTAVGTRPDITFATAT